MLAYAVAGAVRPGQIITWYTEDDEVVDLTGATITGRIVNMNTGAINQITGTLTVTDGPAGEFTWQYSDLDVATAGRMFAQFTAAYTTGPTPARTVIVEWEVKGSL